MEAMLPRFDSTLDRPRDETGAAVMPRAVEPGGNYRADSPGEPVHLGWPVELDRRATSLGVCIWRDGS